MDDALEQHRQNQRNSNCFIEKFPDDDYLEEQEMKLQNYLERVDYAKLDAMGTDWISFV